jgi:predicted TIM-barrel fold metal-dependent hydrolase
VLGEAHWAMALHERTGLPNAMAAQIWLDRDDAADVIGAYREMPLVRSVRHKPKTVARAEHRADFAAPGSMRCARWRRGYALLAQSGLMFELQAPWWHFSEAAELARDFPQMKIIVNHTGLPADRSEEALAAWRAALDALAQWPNVWLKISGIGEAGVSWSVGRNGRIARGKNASRYPSITRRCSGSEPIKGDTLQWLHLFIAAFSPSPRPFSTIKAASISKARNARSIS